VCYQYFLMRFLCQPDDDDGDVVLTVGHRSRGQLMEQDDDGSGVRVQPDGGGVRVQLSVGGKVQLQPDDDVGGVVLTVGHRSRGQPKEQDTVGFVSCLVTQSFERWRRSTSLLWWWWRYTLPSMGLPARAAATWADCEHGVKFKIPVPTSAHVHAVNTIRTKTIILEQWQTTMMVLQKKKKKQSINANGLAAISSGETII
jgi:hypothetical protein